MNLVNEIKNDIIYRCFIKCLPCYISEEEANKIYVYLGAYKYSNECDIEHTPCDYTVNRNSEEADYSLYRNLENYFIDKVIKIKDRNKFEEKNVILFNNSFNRYELIRKEFALTTYKYGQEKAAKRILKKYGGK